MAREPLPESSDLNGDKEPLMKNGGDGGGGGDDKKGKRMRCFDQEEEEDNDNHSERRRKNKMVLEAAPAPSTSSSSNEPFNDNVSATTSEPVLETTTPVRSNPPPLQLAEGETGLYGGEPTMTESTNFVLDDYFSVDEFVGTDCWELEQLMLEEEKKDLEREPVQGQPGADHQ